MYKSALAGLFLCVVIATATNGSNVSAQALNIEKIASTDQPLTEVLHESIDSEKADKATETSQPQIVSHVVQAEDSLSKIATDYQTTWKRLFDKNTAITNPDIITVGEAILIPTADEVLPERPLPQPVTNSQVSAPEPRGSANTSNGSSRLYAGSAGNRYSPGYCTWYVKNMRPDLPNNLGNADTWVSRAAAQGMATGSTPRVGAAGQRGMHVVYVESVNPDGTVTISEMNHEGLYVRTVRTLPASYFTYIY